MSDISIKNQLDPLLRQLSTERSFGVAEKIAAEIVGLLYIKTSERFLANISRIDAEFTRFQLAPGFARQAAAYELPHDDGKLFDLKLFWVKKTNKTNLSWIVGLTPNFEDAQANDYKNIGIDFVVPETCESIIILLSNKFKVRALELKDHITPTQLEIFSLWQKIGETEITDKIELKKTIHSKLWESFNFEPINRKFYLELVEHFSILVHHLEKVLGRKQSVMFTTRLIGRLLFIWFLKKKNLINKNADYFSVPNPEKQTEYYKNQLEKLFFEVLNRDEMERSNGDKLTPYLNGGLFDKSATDFYGDSKLTFPNGYFNQIFDTLNKYNFTVDESSPEFQYVAIDPEMLGRIFESLLAEQVDEHTGNSKKKATGAFYTPREIVSYMCEQSLIEYLKTKIPDAPDRDRRIEELVRMPEAIFRDQDQNKRDKWRKNLGKDRILSALDEILILDPAVGSGAFPMGMLNLLIKVYSRIDTSYEKNLEKHKRKILSRSLYGVDIEQTAIEICRLRAWLSIVVDIPEGEKVDPLPNLEFKFVCANTLIPLDDTEQATFTTDHKLKDKLITIRDEYFKTSSKIKKEKLQKDYLKTTQSVGLFDNKKTKQLKSYKPFDISSSSEFYDPELMHGVQAFDIVIGNPPYIRIHKQNQNKETKETIKRIYQSAYKDFDYYVLFIEKGIYLLKKDGILSYITPDKYLVREYGSKIRKFILQYSILELFDLSRATDVFEAATYPLISIIQKNDSKKTLTIKISKTIQSLNEQYNKISILKEKCINEDRIEIIDPIYDMLIKKIFSQNNRLSDVLDSNQLFCGTPRASDYHEWSKFVSSTTCSSTNTLRVLVCSNLKPYVIDHSKKVRTVGLAITAPFFCNEKSVISKNRWSDFCFVPKILIRGNDTRISAVLDEQGSVFIGIYGIKVYGNIKNSYKYLLALLNSKLYQWIFLIQNPSIKIGGGFFSINAPHILRLPYMNISESQNLIFNNLVDQIISQKKQNKDADTKNLESQIDQLVYKLYDLTPEEIEIVQNAGK